ncbi:MAG: FkbM family methyltransferase [Nanoarchaeota archaeon]
MSHLRTFAKLMHVLSPAMMTRFILVYTGRVKSATIQTKDGVKIFIRGDRQGENQAFVDIFVHETYTRGDFALGAEMTIVDIGAQVGLFSLYASVHATKARIFAFEPVKDNFLVLQKNVRLNRMKRIVPVMQAVSKSTGHAKIFIHPTHTAAHSMFQQRVVPEAKAMSIQTISLADAFVKHNIDVVDFLKIDCQGAEYDILFTAPDDTISKIKKIAMEYHDLDKLRNGKVMQRFLKKKGFQVRSSEEGMLFAWRT